jgi:hypothetical protein
VSSDVDQRAILLAVALAGGVTFIAGVTEYAPKLWVLIAASVMLAGFVTNLFLLVRDVTASP